MMNTETLRRSFSLGGIRIFLMHDVDRAEYRLATRWRWLASFASIYDACGAFEALELVDGDEIQAAKHLKREIQRIPRRHFMNGGTGMGRITYLANSVERRLAGLRPIRTGSKGTVETWIAA